MRWEDVDHFPTKEFVGGSGDTFHYWVEMSETGRELERKYGYIPWLHLANICKTADATYWVEQKVLPMFVPGSPADSPVPYGSGLESSPRAMPRAEWLRVTER